jgi:ERCC4-type nuclease
MIQPENIIALVDSREKLPFDLSPLGTRRATLPTADYSVLGLEGHIAIERKSLTDLLSCVGTNRGRFEKELQRMLSYETRAVIVESDFPELERGEWLSKIRPASVIGSILGWQAMGVPFVLAGSRARAQDYCRRMLFISARRRWREARQLVKAATRT